MSEGIMKCELCQANVMSMGKTTHYYKNLDHERIAQLEQEIKELRTRVADLQRELRDSEQREADRISERDVLKRDYENLREQHKILANTKHKCVKENKELQNRLSTLLKASEGMEFALQNASYSVESDMHKAEANKDYEYLEVIQRRWSGIKQALADFRAVKEGK